MRCRSWLHATRWGLAAHRSTGPESARGLADVRQRPPNPRRLNEVERQPPRHAAPSRVRRPAPAGGLREPALARHLPRVHPHDVPRPGRGGRDERAQEPARPHAYASRRSPRRRPTRSGRGTSPSCHDAEGRLLIAYVIIDLFSRYVVGWMVAARNEAPCRPALRRDDRAPRHRARPPVHIDRGSAMKSDTLAQLLASLAGRAASAVPTSPTTTPSAKPSSRRSSTSPTTPAASLGELHVAAGCKFFGWYNDEHHHSGLALFTPADVFFGRVRGRRPRQAALDTAYAAHPERFLHGRPASPCRPRGRHQPAHRRRDPGPSCRLGTPRFGNADLAHEHALATAYGATPTGPRRSDRNIEFSCCLSHAR